MIAFRAGYHSVSRYTVGMKTVFITGVNKGIGKAVTQKFLDEGNKVIGTSLDGELDYSHENLIILKLDITKDTEIKAVFDFLTQKDVQIDLLINNAGILIDKEEDVAVDIQRMRDTFEVNVFGTINITQHILPFIKDGGQVFNIASSAGQLNREVTSTRYPGYKISKTAINMFTVTLAKRLAPRNITVSSVHPGWVKTDMGGSDADITPEEAAEYIYDFSLKEVESGKFWFKSEQMEW